MVTQLFFFCASCFKKPDPFSEEIFLSILCKLPLAQLGAISSCLVTYYLQTDTHLATTLFPKFISLTLAFADVLHPGVILASRLAFGGLSLWKVAVD